MAQKRIGQHLSSAEESKRAKVIRIDILMKIPFFDYCNQCLGAAKIALCRLEKYISLSRRLPSWQRPIWKGYQSDMET